MSESDLPEIVEDDFIDVELSEAEDDPKEFANARVELEERCNAVGIEVVEQEDVFGDTYLKVGLPSGRDKRWLFLTEAQEVKEFLSVPFERYVMIGNYEAIASYDEGTIEALTRPLRRAVPAHLLYRRLLGRSLSVSEIEEGDKESLRISLFSGDNNSGVKLTLGPPSDTLGVLSQRPYGGRGLSLIISELQVTHHDKAIELLERVANSLFFQIDLMLGFPLTLQRQRRVLQRRRPYGRRTGVDLQFPSHEYDKAPISLYWYARSASEMPLLQFLAYYQVIEFYFPAYSQVEARRKIQNILKNPSFRSDRDADIAKILSAVRSRGSAGFGDERSQLRATLRECLDPENLRDFLTDSEDRQEFLSSKVQGLTDHKIPIANVSADLRDDVADRMYDLRCRIVHTKGEGRNGEVELLLPFSKEAEQLHYDIELAEYVAQRVLISSISPLQI